jgi:hypothetical protein
MNMIARKLKLAPVDGDDVIAVLNDRLRELEARRGVLTKKIIGLEKTAVNRPEVSADMAQAEALLSGAEFVASRDRPMSELSSLHAEREVIDRALKIGRSRSQELDIERATQIWVAHFDQIAKVEKRRVLLALELQRTNREREKLRETIMRAGGAGYLSTDSVDLLGLGEVEEEVKWAVERVIADGIATKAEIEKARLDG